MNEDEFKQILNIFRDFVIEESPSAELVEEDPVYDAVYMSQAILRGSTSYEIPHALVVELITDLFRPDTTEPEWRLGWVFIGTLVSSLIPSAVKPPYKLPEVAPRLFSYCYVEWLIQIKNQYTRRQRLGAAEYVTGVLGIPDKRLLNAFGRQGRHPKEREAAKRLVTVIKAGQAGIIPPKLRDFWSS